jgi:hypothetical protein
MSYSLSSNFVPVELFLAELWLLNLYFLFKFEVNRTFLWSPLIYWLDIWNEAISKISSQYTKGRQEKVWITSNLNKKYKFNGHNPAKSYSTGSGRMIFGWAMALELVFFVQILRCPDLFLTSFDILTWYLVCGYI